MTSTVKSGQTFDSRQDTSDKRVKVGTTAETIAIRKV